MYLLSEVVSILLYIHLFSFHLEVLKSFALQIAVNVILYEIVAIVSVTVTRYRGYENLFCRCSVAALDASKFFRSTKTAITTFSNHYRFYRSL